MKQIAFITVLSSFLTAYQEVNAQGFWYAPPGADLSYRYGIDVGNGLGFGYGFGVGYGSVEGPGIALGPALMDLHELQNQSNAMMLQALEAKRPVAEWTTDQILAELVQKHRQSKVLQRKAEFESRARYLASEATRARSPVPLPFGQYDRSTGEILWPTVLLKDSFADQRSEIETLLKLRAKTGDVGDLNAEISGKIQLMQRELRKQIRTMRSNQYIEGSRFLNQLAVEGQAPVS
jgi:hypothetical protein